MIQGTPFDPNNPKHTESFAHVFKRIGEKLKKRGDKPYYLVDHYHCWAQGGEPACGLPKNTHAICCLCAIPKS